MRKFLQVCMVCSLFQKLTSPFLHFENSGCMVLVVFPNESTLWQETWKQQFLDTVCSHQDSIRLNLNWFSPSGSLCLAVPSETKKSASQHCQSHHVSSAKLGLLLSGWTSLFHMRTLTSPLLYASTVRRVQKAVYTRNYQLKLLKRIMSYNVLNILP